jgi:redox-sensitive bicupin YhaK (pirin superfamily)
MKVKSIEKTNGRMPLRDPYIIGMHHYDQYPKGNGKMGPDADLSDRNLGSDFDPNLPWRMYHGQQVPGFPHHPHRGFEIVTIVPEGFADHFDSKGSTGRYGDGDVQLMSAGRGVLHAEMFPLVYDDQPNPLRLFQIWVNMPGKNKLTEPDYKMIWRDDVPQETFTSDNGAKYSVKVVLGNYEGVQAVAPLKNSWAADPAHHMGIATIKLEPHAVFSLPAKSATMNRFVLFYHGEGMLKVEDREMRINDFADLAGGEEITFTNGELPSEIIILEGEPIGEPVAAYGPFVMNTEQELQEAFKEYRATEFGGWPWGETELDLVHPKDAGRFASYDFGKVTDKPKG